MLISVLPSFDLHLILGILIPVAFIYLLAKFTIDLESPDDLYERVKRERGLEDDEDI